jgi:hypothetical protein
MLHILSYIPDNQLDNFDANKSERNDIVNFLGSTGMIYTQGHYYGSLKAQELYYGSTYTITGNSSLTPNITYICNTANNVITLIPFTDTTTVSNFMIETSHPVTFSNTILWANGSAPETINPNSENYIVQQILISYNSGNGKYLGTYANFK